jgi:hypothetical protein
MKLLLNPLSLTNLTKELESKPRISKSRLLNDCRSYLSPKNFCALRRNFIRHYYGHNLTLEFILNYVPSEMINTTFDWLMMLKPEPFACTLRDALDLNLPELKGAAKFECKEAADAIDALITNRYAYLSTTALDIKLAEISSQLEAIEDYGEVGRIPGLKALILHAL